ncbi:hypothetical protein LP421_08960 [Rhizobium sp. RCAM05350]|nr:hypothetical protein LP421_08960 [Rhizobium sp. RCAM05350]
MIRGLGCALALSVSAMMLSGCVTAAKETAEAASVADEVVPELADAAQAASGSYEDQQVSAVGANGQQQPGAEANAMMPAPNNGQPSSLTMQSTGLNATSNSIFAVQAPNAVPVQGTTTAAGHAPLPVGQATGVNPATNSLFNSGQPAANRIPLPLEGASNANGATAAQQVASAVVGTGGTPLPVAVPIPSSGDSMRSGDAQQPAATQTVSAEGLSSSDGSDSQIRKLARRQRQTGPSGKNPDACGPVRRQTQEPGPVQQ